MKKILLLVAFVFFIQPAFADTIISSKTYNLGGYIVAVQDRGGTIDVQVRSEAPYGVELAYSKIKNTTEDYINFRSIRELDIGFQTAQVLKPQEGIKASDVYSTRIKKGQKYRILITIKTGNMVNAYQQVIWEKPVPAAAPAPVAR